MVETQRRERRYSSACKKISIRACVENWEEKEEGNEWVGRRLLNTGPLVPITIYYTLLSNTLTFSDVCISLTAV